MRVSFIGVLAASLLLVGASAQTARPALHPNAAHLGAPHPLKLPFKYPFAFQHPVFDPVGFKAKFDADMKKDGVPNYIVEFRLNGKTILLDKSGYARIPADGNIPWDSNVRMHIGSVSKLLTAMAMVKLIDHSYDAKTNPWPYQVLIANILPTYWMRGPGLTQLGAGQVDLRHLLQHHSGFTTTSDQEFHPDYQTMKAVIAAGSNDSNTPNYQNVNFSLMRVILAVMNGNISKDKVFPGDPAFNDYEWDGVAVGAYTNYLQSNVFQPAGVNDATLAHPSTVALAYDAASTSPGWDSGDLSAYSGCAGWHLSVDDLLNVMATYMRAGTIVSTPEALGTLVQELGIDNAQASPLGELYSKGGDDFDNAGHMEQAAAMFVPSVKIEAAAFVNMPMGNGDGVESVLVQDFLASIKEYNPFNVQQKQ